MAGFTMARLAAFMLGVHSCGSLSSNATAASQLILSDANYVSKMIAVSSWGASIGMDKDSMSFTTADGAVLEGGLLPAAVLIASLSIPPSILTGPACLQHTQTSEPGPR